MVTFYEKKRAHKATEPPRFLFLGHSGCYWKQDKIKMLLYVLIFVVAVVYDTLYVLWMDSAAKHAYWRSAITSGLIALIGMSSVLSVAKKPLLMVSYVLGMALGSVVGILVKKRWFS